MNLDEAIEILQKEEEDTWMGEEKKWKAAVKLGYEALKQILAIRQAHPQFRTFILPGETED